jgi:mannose-1-phosphate guanylyltransferase
MVLGAGLGTRLRPITDACPKPLVPVGDRSVLAHAAGVLRRAGATRLVVNGYHLRAAVQAAAEALGVAVSVEDDLLGTAGGVAMARGLLGDGDLVVWNGDVVGDVDVAGLVKGHGEGGAEATLVVMPRDGTAGNVGLDGHGRVVRLRRESFGPEVRSADFACVHVLGGALRAALPARGCLVGDVYIPAMKRGATLRAVDHVGAWHDIGGLPAYLDANLAWLRARSLSSWVAPSARVDPEVRLDGTVVGEGASVVGSGTLTRSVVWPGATAVAPLEDAVVMADRVVRRS